MHRLFVYGTLRDADVQRALWAREAPLVPAELPGYRVDSLRIQNDIVVRLSGISTHRILVADPDAKTPVSGYVIELDDRELGITDHYEGSEYRRVSATLTDGSRVWVYVR
ncbi:MAG: gamma-glutamylcyclotransferase family protein [Fimbriimonadaceae bacterium]|nr:gamma-glutamylcyclotransferase family protein [Fimbriimonadaceae bacterium]